MSNQSNTSNDKPRTVQDIIRSIETKLVDGTYIFRGEPECNEKVSSNLFRELEAVQMPYSDIKDVQAEIIADAREYAEDTKNDFEILTDIQHYEGKTNLIDFTTDYNIALFFACYGSPAKCGRIIILQKTEEIKRMLRYPQTPEIRVCAQKSVFVEPPKGYIEQKYGVIYMPKDLKLLVLQHLRENLPHLISLKTIYNDIHGFIRSQKDNWLAYRDFDNGLDWQTKADKARNLREKREACEEAIKYYTNALDRNLESFPVYNNRGVVYEKKGEYALAIEDYNTAMRLKPDDAGAYNNRGIVYSNRGEYERAITDFDKVIELNSDDAEAYNNRGAVYDKKGEYERAITDLNKAIELNSDYASAYNNRGAVYGKKGEYERAITDLNKAIELNSDYAEAYNNRGVVYGNRGEYERAITDFDKAIELNPDYAAAYSNRGVVYDKKGEFDLAKLALQTLTKRYGLIPIMLVPTTTVGMLTAVEASLILRLQTLTKQ